MVEIRKIVSDDIGDVINLYNNVLKGLDNKAWFREEQPIFFDEIVRSGSLYGAFDGNKLVATCSLYLDGIDYESVGEVNLTDVKMGELGLALVDEDYRGRGIIGLLSRHLIDIAKSLGYNMVCATIHPTNMPSVRAFAKLGKVEFLSFYNLKRQYPRVVYAVRI